MGFAGKNTAIYGARSELQACAELLDAGYEVFRNVCPRGIDVMVWDPLQNKGLRVEVKSRLVYNAKNAAGISMAYAVATNQKQFDDYDIICGWDHMGEFVIVYDWNSFRAKYPIVTVEK